MPREPTAAWSAVGTRLRLLRALSGESTRSLGDSTGMSKARISRIELGRSAVALPELDRLLEALRVDQQGRRELVQLVERAHTSVEPFERTMADGRHLQDESADRLAAARRVTVLQAAVVPGLLQTAEYARRLLTLADPFGDQDVAAAVAARMRRQEALYDPSRSFLFLVTESALRWPIGDSGVMAAVYDRIATVSSLSNVTVGLVPFAADVAAVPPDGFSLYDGLADDEPAYVVAELPHAQVFVTRPGDVAIYLDLVEKFRTAALYGNDAVAFLHALPAGHVHR